MNQTTAKLKPYAKKAKQQANEIKKVVSETVSAVRSDIKATRERDPAARSDAEVALLYSGVHALAAYRVAHRLHKHGHFFAARAISQAARFVTGIEIS